jgi:hypothetical protein
MTISDSIPVQFWDIDEETFNEKAVCGMVKQDCFCQPFQCSDTIKIQFYDPNPFHWGLHVFDTSDQLITEIDFEEIATGYWQTDAALDGSPCDQKVYFKIQKSEVFSDGTFDFGNGYSVITTDAQLGDAWSIGGGVFGGGLGTWSHSSYLGNLAAYVTLTTAQSASPKTIAPLVHRFEQIQYAFRNFSYSFRQGSWSTTFGSWTGGTIEAVYYLDGSEIGTQVIVSSLSQNTSYSGTFNTSLSGWNAIGIRIKWTSSGSPFLGTNEMYVLTFDINGSLGSEYVAKSDCIELRETQDCTVLIEYENTSNFDGVNYEAGSPGPSFQLRIPAMFFEEENPQEQEDLELSNGVIVTLRQSIVEKRKMETGFMPNYMHRKLQKILMHDSVYIDGDYWKKRDSYDTSPVKKYNLKTASVFLTKYDSVEKNTI